MLCKMPETFIIRMKKFQIVVLSNHLLLSRSFGVPSYQDSPAASDQEALHQHGSAVGPCQLPGLHRQAPPAFGQVVGPGRHSPHAATDTLQGTSRRHGNHR